MATDYDAPRKTEDDSESIEALKERVPDKLSGAVDVEDSDNPSVGLVVGGVITVVVVAAMIALSPVIEVRDGWLHAGRAKIELRFLGEPEALTDEAARAARGPELDPRSWMLVRPGIDGIVRIPLEDPRDPAPMWVLSSRTPDRLSAVIRAARPGV